jgi:hypothetical protein
MGDVSSLVSKQKSGARLTPRESIMSQPQMAMPSMDELEAVRGNGAVSAPAEEARRAFKPFRLQPKIVNQLEFDQAYSNK